MRLFWLTQSSQIDAAACGPRWYQQKKRSETHRIFEKLLKHCFNSCFAAVCYVIGNGHTSAHGGRKWPLCTHRNDRLGLGHRSGLNFAGHVTQQCRIRQTAFSLYIQVSYMQSNLDKRPIFNSDKSFFILWHKPISAFFISCQAFPAK